MNQADIPFPRALVRYWAHQTPLKPAVITGDDEVITYDELGNRTAEASELLHEFGVSVGVRVAVALPNSLDHIIWLFGVFESGGIAIPLDPRLPSEETKALLDDSGANYLIVSSNSPSASLLGETLLRSASNTILRRRTDIYNCGNTNRNADGLLIQFTSGSTGRPKRILRTESQIFEDYRHFAEGIGLQADDRLLAIAPFYHAYGALGMYAVLSEGGVIMPLGRFLPAEVLRKAKHFYPTLLLTTPPMIEMLGKCFLKNSEDNALSSVRHTICSTGYLGREAYELFFKRFGIRTRIQYGTTETLSAAVTDDGGYQEKLIGNPYPGVEVRIFDDQGKPLPKNRAGRIGIRSPAVSVTYDSGELLERIDGFVLPGDRGMVDTAGNLYWLGRDDLYNIGGYKVARGEIESLISSGFDVSYVAVLPYLRAGQPSLRALIESTQPDISPDAVMKACREKLPPYKVPSRIDIYGKLPRHADGTVRNLDIEELEGQSC